jgi:polyisoprenyl-phosphate glycosyltransferase
MDTDSHSVSASPGQPGRRRLCVIVPCYNEQEVLRLFCAALRKALDSVADLEYRILFVDDGSGDKTLEILEALAAEDPRVKLCSFSRNFGHQVALSAGLDAADGDAVLFMDCDLQHPPELIPRMVGLWREGYEVVSAVRSHTADASLVKRMTSGGFYWLINKLSSIRIVPGAADFCLLARPAYEALRNMPERRRFLRGMVSWVGFRRAEVPFEAPPRAAGTSKYTLLMMLRFAADAIFSFSAAPMRFFGRIGLAAAGLGAMLLLAALAKELIWGYAYGTMLAGLILLLGGLQLMAAGIAGEYLARIFEEVKRRPLYVLKKSPERNLWD